MGLAVPSVSEASRGLPSVKPALPAVDDDRVTSVAGVLPVDEPVSPELALVDPVLAARLRALLPEIELQIGLEPDPPPPTLRVLPDPEPDNVLPLRPPPELLDEPVAAAPAPAVAPVVVPPLFPSRADRWRALAKSFAAGAAVATFVTVGVVAKLGEGPPEQPLDAGTVPPRTAPAATGAAAGGALAGKSATGTPETGQGAGATARRPPAKSPTTSEQAPAPKRAQTPAPKRAQKSAAAPQTTQKGATASKQAAAPARAAKTTQKPKSKPADNPEHARNGKYPTAKPIVPAPRRFAWAPVDGAIGYRIELFRGTRQVLEERTTDPAYELVSPWRHAGRTEELTSGSYRWYVWPVFSSGPAAQAVVQAQLRVP